MTCDIFIRSYYKDLEWLKYNLRAIQKFCAGFRKTILVVPESSRERVQRAKIDCDEIFFCANYKDDYLGQQVTKVYADKFTDADMICHLDADCIFSRPVTPEDFLSGDKVRFYMAHYDFLPKSTPWRAVTEKFLGRPVGYDFMQRQPQVYPRWVYSKFRALSMTLHGIELLDYILTQPARGFSEYNAMGAFLYSAHRSEFHWVDLYKDPHEPSACNWYWSWAGVTSEIEEELERLLD